MCCGQGKLHVFVLQKEYRSGSQEKAFTAPLMDNQQDNSSQELNSALLLLSFFFLELHFRSLSFHFCSQLKIQYLYQCVFVVYRMHEGLSSISKVMKHPHTLSDRCKGDQNSSVWPPLLAAAHTAHQLLTVLTLALIHSKFNQLNGRLNQVQFRVSPLK